ncbi:MAG TPA: ATP-binding protein, partial [Pirellulales bacterium]
AMNPCPCGYRTDPRRECHCSVPQIERYMSRISGPLLDRIDIHMEVPNVPFEDLSKTTPGTSSESMREQVDKARAAQARRFAGKSTRTNARMSSREVRQFCPLERPGAQLLQNCMADLGLSARAYDKILRVARTIADLAGSESIQTSHLSEAINYRTLDRKMWT